MRTLIYTSISTRVSPLDSRIVYLFDGKTVGGRRHFSKYSLVHSNALRRVDFWGFHDEDCLVVDMADNERKRVKGDLLDHFDGVLTFFL